jgi:hypothetical protein
MLHDSLEQPFIWWPRTLLEYPIQLADSVNPIFPSEAVTPVYYPTEAAMLQGNS